MNVPYKWRVAVVVLIGPALGMMDTTIVSVILSQLRQAFHADFGTVNLVAGVYFLAQAAVIPIVGYLSDRLGSKRVYLAALALFTVSSLLCSLSPTLGLLVVFRVLQGLGAGALLPMAFSINYRIFPPTERSKVSAVMSIPILLAPTFGPTLGGYLSTTFDWHFVFLINVPLGSLALFLSFLILPGRNADKSDQAKQTRGSFDIVGLVLSLVGVTFLVYGISLVGSNGWGDALVLTTLLIGAVALIVFVVVELRVSDPVLDLRLLKNPTFTISNILTWFTLALFTGSAFLLPLFLENVQNQTPLIAGQSLIGQGLGIAAGTLASGTFYNRLKGPRILAVCGLFLLACGTYGLTQLNVDTPILSLQFWLVLRGFGLGFANRPIQLLAFSEISNKSMARASSLVNVARQMAGATAVAALTTYMIIQAATHTTEINSALQTGLQTHNLTGVAATCAQAAGPALQTAVLKACIGQHATATAIDDAFWVILILTAASVLFALVLRSDPTLAALKQAQQAKIPDSVAIEPVPTLQTESVPSAVSLPTTNGKVPGYAGVKPVPALPIGSVPTVISPLGTNGEEIIGSEILVWRDDVMNGSMLIVDSKHFCVLKACDRVLNVYETGRHIIQNLEESLYGVVQLAFDGTPISVWHQALYINRTPLVVRSSGFAFSREMAMVEYYVDYTIHVATPEDAIQLVRSISYRGSAFTVQQIEALAGPLIEQTVSQLLRSIPLREVLRQHRPNLSPLVYQRLQKFLSRYGVTLTTISIFVVPHYVDVHPMQAVH